MDNKLKEIIKQIAKKYDVTQSDVEEVFRSQFKFIRKITTENDIKNKTVDEVRNLKTNFNIPGMYKMILNYKILENIKNNKNKKNE